MGALTLSSAERAMLAETMRLALSPLDHPERTEWQRALIRAGMELLRADKGAMSLPLEGQFGFIGENLAPTAGGAYVELVSSLDARLSGFEVAIRLGVHTRAMLWEPFGDAYFRHPYHHELVVPLRLFGALCATISLGGRAGVLTTSQLFFHHDRESQEPFGDREIEIMRLLYPALGAGVKSLMRLDAFRPGLSTVLDQVPHGMRVTDGRGRVIHENRGLAEILDADPARKALRQELEALAMETSRYLGRDPLHGPSNGLAPLVRRVRTEMTTYLLTGTLVHSDLSAGFTMVLVSLECLVPPLPTEADVRTRFGLTPAQARVALRMAKGMRDRDIAAETGLSVHTVRHHGEQVRLRLGVASRAQVASRLAAREAPGA